MQKKYLPNLFDTSYLKLLQLIIDTIPFDYCTLVESLLKWLDDERRRKTDENVYVNII